MKFGFLNRNVTPTDGDLDNLLKGPAVGMRGLGDVAVVAAIDAPPEIDAAEFTAACNDDWQANRTRAVENHQRLKDKGRSA